MNQKKEIKIALVGARFAADLHMEAYNNVPGINVEIVGIASKDLTNASAFCTKHQLDNSIAYDDASSMIKEVDAEIIDLVVPPFLHVPFAIKAAKAGKNVICEKPLTGYFGDLSIPIENRNNVGLTDKRLMFQECLKDCERIDRVFADNEVIFCYAENWVYAPPIVKAKRLLKASKGKILEIRGGEGHSGSHSPFAAEWKYTGGGALFRMGAHPYGAAVHLKIWEGLTQEGKPIYPDSVIATVTKNRDLLKDVPSSVDYVKSRPVDVEDWSCGIITFEDGTNAVIFGSDITLGGVENWFNIYASNTRIECKLSNNNTVMSYAPTDKQFEEEYTIEKIETKAGWSSAQPNEHFMFGYPGEMTDFFHSVLEKKNPDSDLNLAIWSTKVMYAAYLSAEAGQRIEIPKDYKFA
ncbi:MAG: Gfo/Idh/MocA family protein [Promethearchaeota archaeon]